MPDEKKRKRRGWQITTPNHELKTDPEPFSAVWERRKRAEARLNDRDFKDGDNLTLRETVHTGDEMAHSGKPLIYTGRSILVRVTHIQPLVMVGHTRLVMLSFETLSRFAEGKGQQ